MTPFDPTCYPEAIAELWSIDRLPELGPGTPNHSVRSKLESLRPETVSSHLLNREAALACLSGLWRYHDFLSESHTISQDLHGWFGSYWHGIMHRREPDPDNAKYWLRRVGDNPVAKTLAADAVELGVVLPGEKWGTFRFVDLCERVCGTNSEEERACRQVQRREMQLLFDWCYRAAVGPGTIT